MRWVWVDRWMRGMVREGEGIINLLSDGCRGFVWDGMSRFHPSIDSTHPPTHFPLSSLAGLLSTGRWRRSRRRFGARGSTSSSSRPTGTSASCVCVAICVIIVGCGVEPQSMCIAHPKKKQGQTFVLGVRVGSRLMVRTAMRLGFGAKPEAHYTTGERTQVVGVRAWALN